MHSIVLGVAVAGLAGFAHAFTKPTNNTWGPLLTPDLTHPVTQGEPAQVTWDPESHPTNGVTVSLVLCHGPSTNCVLADTAIVEGLPASQKAYTWNVPADLAPGTQSTETGYGMLIIVDGTGEFQYSTQFSVLAANGSTSTTATSASTSSTAKPTSSVTSTGATSGTWATWETTYTTPSNGTHGTTKTGSWPTAATTAAGSAVISSTVAVQSSTGTAAGAVTSGSTSTATASGVSPSTFQGSASHSSFSVASLVIAGSIAAYALYN